MKSLAKKVKIVLNNDAISTELLKNPAIASYCEDIARARMPDGCEIDTRMGQKRAIVEMRAVTRDAIKDNLENNTLLKAVSR